MKTLPISKKLQLLKPAFKFKLKTSNNIRTKPEDITLQGSHNTLLNLTSENNNLDSEDQSSGKIELTSGYNERLKNENNSETEILDSITLEKYVDRESHHINLYNNLSPEVFNGVFYERIKNQSQFLNREILSSNIIKNINLFEDNSLLSHKSSFVISEQNLEGYLLNKKQCMKYLKKYIKENTSASILTMVA